MPTSFVPYNRFAHVQQPAGGAYSKALVPASYAGGMQYAPQYVPMQPTRPAFATFQHKDRAITFHNIANPNMLRIEAPAMEPGAPPMQMKLFKNEARDHEYRMEYIPKGDTHKVSASYGGYMMNDFPVIMAPQAPHVQVTDPGSEFKIYNIHQPEKLAVHSLSLPYKASIDGTTVTVKHQPGLATHNVECAYKGQPIQHGGKFCLAPHPEKVRAVKQAQMAQQQAQMQQQAAMAQQMRYRQLPYGSYGYASPQLMAPAGYAQGMQVAAPAMLNAGVPMQQAPTLMTPRALPGQQPMRRMIAGAPVHSQQGPPVKPGYSQVQLGYPQQPMYV